MPLFVRKSSKGDWDTVDSQTPEDLNFPAAVLADILDNANETSVWEIDDPPGPELNHIVAALHSRGIANLSDVTLRVASEWKIKTQLGLSMRKTKGDSLDSSLNNSGKHWVVLINTVGEAIRLAKALKEKPPIFFSQAETMRAFASSLAAGRIKSDAVGSGLVKKLFEEGYLQFVASQTQPAVPASAPTVATGVPPAPTG